MKNKKELEIVIKWCEKWQQSNSNQRCFKSFRHWVQAAAMNGRIKAEKIGDDYFKNKIEILEKIINKPKIK